VWRVLLFNSTLHYIINVLQYSSLSESHFSAEGRTSNYVAIAKLEDIVSSIVLYVPPSMCITQSKQNMSSRRSHLISRYFLATSHVYG
jgi:hypothetical protein